MLLLARLLRSLLLVAVALPVRLLRFALTVLLAVGAGPVLPLRRALRWLLHIRLTLPLALRLFLLLFLGAVETGEAVLAYDVAILLPLLLFFFAEI